MQFRISISVALLAAAAVYGQSESAHTIDKSHAYVRRFTAGGTLNVFGLAPIKDRTTTVNTTSPPVSGTYTTTGESQRIGFGATGQIAVTTKIAVNVSFFVHRVAYLQNNDEYFGVFDPSSLVDNRTHQVSNENTHAHFYDVPLTLRYYFKSRFAPGPRFFAEAGGSWRHVTGISTETDTTINSGNTVCCNTTPITPAHSTTYGLVAGVGAQFIDPFGIRVIPEVRYTRWQDKIFDNLSTSMQLNQIEAMVTLSF